MLQDGFVPVRKRVPDAAMQRNETLRNVDFDKSLQTCHLWNFTLHKSTSLISTCSLYVSLMDLYTTLVIIIVLQYYILLRLITFYYIPLYSIFCTKNLITIILHYIIFYYNLLSYHIISYYIILYDIILWCIILYDIMLYYIILYDIILCFIMLY